MHVKWHRRLLLILVVPLVSVLLLEATSRLVHWGRAPLLPYYFDEGAAFLPEDADIYASFYGLRTNRYTTDRWGARIAHPEDADSRQAEGIFVIGDSQALGYMLDFDETFASQLAERLVGDSRAARVLAAPANHPETFQPALVKYAPNGLEKQRLCIFAINLGNDLDEMYSEGLNWDRGHTPPLRIWLSTHSFFYLDLVLLRTHQLQAGEDLLGVNRILYMLQPDERVVLVRQTVDIVLESIAAAGIDNHLVLVIPADIQVDPSQFDKYRRYYPNQDRFEEMRERQAEFATMMDAVERYLVARLEQRGETVVTISDTLRHADADCFDASSHHLTADAHRLIVQEILRVMDTTSFTGDGA